TLRAVPEQISNIIPENPGESALLRVFQQLPESLAKEDRARLVSESERLYRDELVPAYKKLHEFVEQKYLPAARETISWNELPHGTEWYALHVRAQHTTK